MIREQLEARGIEDPRLLAAFERTPRELFVEPALWPRAYHDGPLPIGAGQTISQPYTVAFMIDAMRLKPRDRVLEVGGGCGYSAAILSHIVEEVHSIERIGSLIAPLVARMRKLGRDNVHVHEADGSRGWPEAAPYDAIVVAAGGANVPQPLLDQLVESGRLVIPLGSFRNRQIMHRFTRLEDNWTDERLGRFAFVPLIGEHGWREED